MRYLKIKLFLGVVVIIMCLTSCRKDNDSESGFASGEGSVAKYLFDAVKDEVDQQLNLQGNLNGIRDDKTAEPRGGCATVSISPLGIVFPKVVNITFPQGCKTFAGAEIEGTIVININGKVRENGSIATFSLNNFLYKGYKLSGDYVVTFTGINSHTTVINNGKIITPDNRIISYSASNSAAQIEGMLTTFKTHPFTFLQDDVYEITSESMGINSKGHHFSMATTGPLVYRVDCQWITSGTISITEAIRPNVKISFDYGDGICDNKAQLTINNTSTTITLP